MRTAIALLPNKLWSSASSPGLGFALQEAQVGNKGKSGMEIYSHLDAPGFYVENAPHPLYLRICRSNWQCCGSRGDLHCQVDLWCIWADRSPRAREEVGLQRKEERRLNLNQNVWLPTLGKGRGNGGRVEKVQRNLYDRIRKKWKDLKGLGSFNHF